MDILGFSDCPWKKKSLPEDFTGQPLIKRNAYVLLLSCLFLYSQIWQNLPSDYQRLICITELESKEGSCNTEPQTS
jgi:hypothetical protein